jgi:PAS domain S-box-containing protein
MISRLGVVLMAPMFTLWCAYALAEDNQMDVTNNTMLSVLDSMPDVIFYKDLTGIYRGGNRAWEKLVGKPRSEVIGKSDYDLFPHDVATSFSMYDREMLESGTLRKNKEMLTYPDGHTVWVETTKMPWLGRDGELLGVLGTCREIFVNE